MGKAKLLVAALIAAALGAALLTACGSSTSGTDQFRDKTDSGLLDFGEAGSASEQEEATKAVHDFFLARSQGDWPGACAQLSRSILAKIEHLATTATGLANTSCPSFLDTFIELSDQERRDSTVVDSGSLRQKGDHGYLIYSGAHEVVYAMPLSREGDAWKLDSLSSKRLS